MTAVPVEGEKPDTRQDDQQDTTPATVPDPTGPAAPAEAAAEEPAGAGAPAGPSPDEESAPADTAAPEATPADGEAAPAGSAAEGTADGGSTSADAESPAARPDRGDGTPADASGAEAAPTSGDSADAEAEAVPEADAEGEGTPVAVDAEVGPGGSAADGDAGDAPSAGADAAAGPEATPSASESATAGSEGAEEETPAEGGTPAVAGTQDDAADVADAGTAEGGTPAAGDAQDVADAGPAEEPVGSGPEVEGAGAPARDVERTSTFVALKPLDPVRESPATGRTGAEDGTAGARAGAAAAGRGTDAAGTGAAGQDAGVAEATAAVPVPVPELTKEQPLPPLDLLAQLTNTPPPPETPARTWVRRVKVWTPLLLLAAGAFATVQMLRPLPAPELTTAGAAASFTAEGSLSLPWPAAGQGAIRVQGTGDVGTFGPQKPVPTASVAKIMTAYVVLKDHPLKKDEDGPRIPVDDKAVQQGAAGHESRIVGLTAGSEFSQQDMLKMLMIPSGNNIARLLARWDAGSDTEAAFVAKMNAAAKELGMTNTTYTDPSGLDARTVSTAADQLKLAEAVMKFDVFRKIVAMPNATIPGLAEPINNNNDDLLLAGLSIKGIKTGSSTPAGGTLVWAAYKTVGDRTPLVIGAMMDQHVSGPDPDGANSLKLVKANSQKVIEAVREALTSVTVVKKGQVVGYLDDRLGGRTPLVATREVRVVGVPGQKLALTLGDGGKALPHEAKAGTPVGTLTVGSGPDTTTVPVAVQGRLAAPSFGAKLTRLG